jgi:hypothetical protein
MRFGRELVEPWGLLLAASSAGVAWAVQLPAVAVAGVGVAVLAARAGVASLGGSSDPAHRRAATAAPDVDEGSTEGQWLRRARAAAAAFDSISGTLAGGPLAGQVGAMGSGITETVASLHRLAGRASTTGAALNRIDPVALAAERARLAAGLDTVGDDVRADLEHAMAAVQAQQDVHARLTAARTKLLAQLQSGALGLESLTARLVELSTATDYTVVDTSTIAELADQLEGVRRGILETEKITRSSLDPP